jgi:phosphate transport system substrate-binding protein
MRRFVASFAALAAVALARPAPAQELLINGAGATFPAPLYQKWFSEYHAKFPAIGFNYQAIGSGGGIQQFTAGTVDFGASDAPLTDEEWAKIKDAVHIPTVLGAVVITFNSPVQGLKLTPELLADIYLGKITKWNDKALAEVNPGLKLPDTDIAVMHRADGSGTTNIFTDYLSKVSPEWKEKVGMGKSVKWPVGLGGKGNEGVTGLVKQTPGAIGYVELAYATQNGLPMAQLKNKAGVFVSPSIASTSAAAAGVAIPDDYRVSVTNAEGKDAYPIASFTYLLVHKDAKDGPKGKALVEFLWWAVHDGQKFASPLDYAPLPQAVVEKVAGTIKSLTVQGKPVSIAAK